MAEKNKNIKQSYQDIPLGKLTKVAAHKHNGLDSEKIDPKNLRNGFFKIVSGAPTEAPKRFIDQIQIFSDGEDSILYVWDNENEVWLRFNYYTAP